MHGRAEDSARHDNLNLFLRSMPGLSTSKHMASAWPCFRRMAGFAAEQSHNRKIAIRRRRERSLEKTYPSRAWGCTKILAPIGLI